jgi:hypothetical protein
VRTPGYLSEVIERVKQHPRSPSTPAKRSKPEIYTQPSEYDPVGRPPFIAQPSHVNAAKGQGLAQVVDSIVVNIAHACHLQCSAIRISLLPVNDAQATLEGS